MTSAVELLRKMPDFVPAQAVLGDAAAALLPPREISIAQWAEENRRLENPGGGYSGQWSFDLAPYLREPTDALGPDSPYSIVVFQGSAQMGKTELGLNWAGHTIDADPADMIVCQPDKELTREFMVARVTELVAQTPALREKVRTDNQYEKRFRGGTSIYGIWPVAAQFRQRPVPRWWLDDYDEIPDDIDGQGAPITLAEGRGTTFEGRTKGLVTSSPAKGDGRGINAEFRAGTQKLWHWPCPHCGGWFAAAWPLLHVDDGGTLRPLVECEADEDPLTIGPARARATAVIVCPHSGCVIEQKHKAAMNRAGRWCGPLQQIVDGEVIGDELETRIASFRICGLAGFASWPRLAELYVEAVEAWRLEQDAVKLRAFYNTQLGENYVGAAGNEAPIDADELKLRPRGEYRLGQVPAGVEALTAAVDVQGNRFEVLVVGWKAGLASAIVDRYAILETAEGRPVRPSRYPEHWLDLLPRVLFRRYPLAEDPEETAPILGVAIDSQGEPGVYENALKFWHAVRAAGVAERAFSLIKGAPKANGPIVPLPTLVEVRGSGRRKLKGGARLYVVNVNAAKDVVNARLHRDDGGAGSIEWPADLDDEYLDELASERKDGKLWVKRSPRQANETFDLMGYNVFALKRWIGERGDFATVPRALKCPASANTVRQGDGGEAPHADDETPAPAPVSAPGSSTGASVRPSPRGRGRGPRGGFVGSVLGRW